RFAALVARNPGRIDVGGVDRGQARRREPVEHGERGFFIRRPAEHVAAENERRDGKVGAPQTASLHERLPGRETIAEGVSCQQARLTGWLTMVMAVMKIRIVRMPVAKRLMPVPVRMRLRYRPVMGVSMMFVMKVAVFMLDRLVRVFVAVSFRQMKPH